MEFTVEWDGDVTLVHPEREQRAKQDVNALFGVNGVTTPSKHLSLLVTSLRPGEKSNVHYHVEHESALYGIRGSVHFFWGKELEHDLVVGVGDFLYIPPFCPHVSYNRSLVEDAAFVTARTDAFEQERVVTLPELEDDRCKPRVSYVD
ncbi:cupin domain-containing protein [Amycolatopsis sp. WGS_07]|uniref:cupin domain-containing protein n=1 Tax=Amycolatopsis sp. WGS_07 TaxID=3076764 RepID=UPI003872D322